MEREEQEFALCRLLSLVARVVAVLLMKMMMLMIVT
jgi:hypothetical protein